MKFCEQDLIHTQWMLKRQINNCDDLIHFWILNGPAKNLGPVVERCRPVWYHDLPEVTTLIRKKNRNL